MPRTILLIAVWLILVSASSADAQTPFKNKTALAAKKNYEVAIAKAKKEYAAKLEIAVKDAGGTGDLEEATRLAAEKKRIEGIDPLTTLRRRLIGTKWYTNPKRTAWSRFEKDNLGISERGNGFLWVVTSKNTVVFQYVRSLTIYVWHFDDNVKATTLHSFKKTGNMSQGRRAR